MVRCPLCNRVSFKEPGGGWCLVHGSFSGPLLTADQIARLRWERKRQLFEGPALARNGAGSLPANQQGRNLKPRK
jgi:hypothetical protein